MKIPFGRFLQALLLTIPAVANLPSSYGQATSNAKPQVFSSAPLLKPIDKIKLKDILDKNKGKVVVINFWATWCEPCRDELPELVRLYKNFRQKGMRLILLSVEEHEQSEQVIRFLEENKIDFVTYLRSEGDFESLVDLIDANWMGALPTTFFINRQGRRVQSMVGGHNYADFASAIEPLL